MVRKSAMTVLVLALVCLCIPAMAATYYVNINAVGASDSNPGTQSQPWYNIDAGDHNNVLHAGDTVKIEPGTYTSGAYGSSQAICTNTCSGVNYVADDAAAYTWDVIVGGVRPMQTAGATNNSFTGLVFDGGSNVGGYLVLLQAGATHYTFTGCEFRNLATAGGVCGINDNNSTNNYLTVQHSLFVNICANATASYTGSIVGGHYNTMLNDTFVNAGQATAKTDGPFTNCIFEGSKTTAVNGGAILGGANSSYNLFYNNVSNGTTGINSITGLDPLLDANYRPMATSPALGAGLGGVDIGYYQSVAVPEPGSLVALMGGLVGLIGLKIRRRG